MRKKAEETRGEKPLYRLLYTRMETDWVCVCLKAERRMCRYRKGMQK